MTALGLLSVAIVMHLTKLGEISVILLKITSKICFLRFRVTAQAYGQIGCTRSHLMYINNTLRVAKTMWLGLLRSALVLFCHQKTQNSKFFAFFSAD
jgi:hypothetical protein